MKRLLLILPLLLLIACSTPLEGPYTVTKIVDGDTLILNTSDRVRLQGINTPEKDQCYYQEATNNIKFLENKQVYLSKDAIDYDQYGRLLRYIYYNNTNINLEQIKQGYAVVFDRYSYSISKYKEFKLAENIAKENRLGLWQCTNKTLYPYEPENKLTTMNIIISILLLITMLVLLKFISINKRRP